jgi:hypothetical protein
MPESEEELDDFFSSKNFWCELPKKKITNQDFVFQEETSCLLLKIN